MTGEFVAVVLCLFASAFFSASETALSSLPITRLEAMRASQGRLSRKGLDRWAVAPQELLITILVGNNLVNVLASALATRIAYRLSSSGGLAWAVGVTTLIILVWGEITPKTLAQRYAQQVAARVAPVLYVLDIVLRPINRVLGALTRVLTPRHVSEAPVTEADLVFMLRLAHRHAQLPREARLMIESVLRFQRTVAREVMVPRPRVVTVDASWRLDELQRVVAAAVHSRFPVVRGSPDEIVGVLHAKSLQRLAPPHEWLELVVPAVFIPETKQLPELLHELRKRAQHMAIVLDEFGGFEGVVTLEDTLELLVGEIEDEFDRERDPEILRHPHGLVVPAHLGLRRLERMLHRGIRLPEDADSVGGLVSRLSSGPIVAGVRVAWDSLDLEVLDAEEGRATRILVRRQPALGQAQAP